LALKVIVSYKLDSAERQSTTYGVGSRKKFCATPSKCSLISQNAPTFRKLYHIVDNADNKTVGKKTLELGARRKPPNQAGAIGGYIPNIVDISVNNISLDTFQNMR